MADNDQTSHEEELKRRFPKLRFKKSPPLMFTLNGFGIGIYGHRDADQETGTYVKTTCLCALWIPLFPLSSYRVADAAQGWYFLGKEPLSRFAVIWQSLIWVVILGFAGRHGWDSYQQQPSVQAKKALASAEQHLEAHELKAAADDYLTVLQSNWPRELEAAEGLNEVIEEGLNSQTGESAALSVYAFAMMPVRFKNGEVPMIPDFPDRAAATARRLAEGDPREAMLVLNEIEKHRSRVKALSTFAGYPGLRREILEKAVAKYPDDSDLVLELAAAFEKEENLPAAAKLLEPIESTLGESEGARILGQARLADGQIESAVELLNRYVSPRLGRLHKAETDYEKISQKSYDRALKDLEAGRGNPIFFRNYDGATTDDEKNRLVLEELNRRVEGDKAYQAALESLRDANGIVPVAFDLGVAELSHAQAQSTNEERTKWLEEAERTFLALQNSAGNSDEYRLFLGEVYYWLGKFDDGKTLFDQFLENQPERYSALMILAQTLRRVGEERRVREMTEEAHRIGSTDDERFAAARLRANTESDVDDRIKWLEKANPSDPEVIVSLHTMRAAKALEKGDETGAEKGYRAAIAGYEKMPESAATLNNSALVFFQLFQVTGNVDDYAEGAFRIGKAAELAPTDSILAINSSSSLFQSAILSVLSETFDLKVANRFTGIQGLRWLYGNSEEREKAIERLRNHRDTKAAIQHLEKGLLLAPKNESAYAIANNIYSTLRDTPALDSALQRLLSANLDLAPDPEETEKKYSSEEQEKRIESLNTSLNTLNSRLENTDSDEVTRAYLSGMAFHARVALHELGVEQDLNALARIADEMAGKFVNTYSQDLALSIRFELAEQALKKQDAEFQKLCGETQKFLSAPYRVLFWIESHPDRVPVMGNLPEMKALTETIADSNHRFPDTASITDWIILSSFQPDLSEEISKSATANRISRTNLRLELALDPLNPTNVLNETLYLSRSGKIDEARRFYGEAKAKGVPLPEWQL